MMTDMTYIHKGPMRCKVCHILKEPHEHPEEWWVKYGKLDKGDMYYDVAEILAESRRRTLDDVREILMAEWKEDRNAHSVELLNNVLSKLDEMK